MEIEWKDASILCPLDKPLWIFVENRTLPVFLAVKQSNGLTWAMISIPDGILSPFDGDQIKAWAEFYYPPAPQVRWEA